MLSLSPPRLLVVCGASSLHLRRDAESIRLSSRAIHSDSFPHRGISGEELVKLSSRLRNHVALPNPRSIGRTARRCVFDVARLTTAWARPERGNGPRAERAQRSQIAHFQSFTACPKM